MQKGWLREADNRRGHRYGDADAYRSVEQVRIRQRCEDDRPAQHFEQIDITEAKEDSQGQPENRVAEKGLGRTELVPVGIQDGGVIVRQRVGQQLVDTTSDEETFLGGVQFSTLQHVHPLVAVGDRYDQVSQ